MTSRVTNGIWLLGMRPLPVPNSVALFGYRAVLQDGQFATLTKKFFSYFDNILQAKPQIL